MAHRHCGIPRITHRTRLEPMAIKINKRVLFLGCINDEHVARRQQTCLAHE